MSAEDRRVLKHLVPLVLVVYLLSMAGRLTSGDGETVYQTTRALLTRLELGVPARPETAPGRNGHYYGKYGIGQTLVEAPFYGAGRVVGRLFGARDDRPERFAVSMTNSFVCAALAAVFWLTVRALGGGRGAATSATLVFAFCTLTWPYARSDFSEPLQSLALVATFHAALRWRRSPSASWAVFVGVSAGAAFLTKAASAILLAPIGAYFAYAVWTRRAALGRAAIGHLVLAALPFAACAALQLALNVYRFGKVTEFGYGSEPEQGFTTPLFTGVQHLLISSGKGLFLFAPPVLLGLGLLPALARRFRAEALAIAAIFLVELAYFARWWAWHGDWSWGPRYMVVTVPFVMLTWGAELGQRHAWLRGIGVALAAAGAVVSLLGVVIDYGGYYSIVGSQIGRGVDVKEARLVPEFSPILGHAWLARASWHDTISRWQDPTHDPRDNPAQYQHPWAARYPDLTPEAPDRAYGFDLWFMALSGRSRFAEYWSWLGAAWLAVTAVVLGRGLRSALCTPRGALPRPRVVPTSSMEPAWQR